MHLSLWILRYKFIYHVGCSIIHVCILISRMILLLQIYVSFIWLIILYKMCGIAIAYNIKLILANNVELYVILKSQM